MTRDQQTLRVQACEAIAEIEYMRKMGGLGLPWNQTDPVWRAKKVAEIAANFDAAFTTHADTARIEALEAKPAERLGIMDGKKS